MQSPPAEALHGGDGLDALDGIGFRSWSAEAVNVVDAAPQTAGREAGVDLQDWADLGTVAAAGVNIALVFLALRQLGALRRQVEHEEQAVVAAKQSADAAESTVRESTRARVDQEAPRVIALMEAPEWPPFVDMSRSRMPYGNEPRLLERLGQASVAGDDPFVFDEQESWFMWFRARGVLFNEGRGTARVRVDGESRFVSGTTDLYKRGLDKIEVPPRVGTPSNCEYLLQPGGAALFEWAYGHTLAEWADAQRNPTPTNPHGAGFVQITSSDHFEQGVVDFIFVELEARPIEPVPNRQGHWRLCQDNVVAVGVTVYPSIRVYRSEGGMVPEEPWRERYAAWNEENR